jgi:HlyD family secretion protein
MTRLQKGLIGTAIVIVLGSLAGAAVYLKRTPGKSVTVEAIKARDLEALVSASGKIQARTTVNISADTVGRITELAVEEGDRVKKGQFLMQIDPRNQRSAVERGEASLGEARSALEAQRLALTSARENLALARESQRRQRDLWAQQLTTREALDKAENEVKVRESDLREKEQSLATQDQRIRQAQAQLSSAQYDLSKVRIESPLDGIVTRRSIEEGEMVVVGTMNNAGTVLLTIADMSIIEAEVEVDETDIPTVRLGQPAKVTIDAINGQTFVGKVTEIGNSPIQQTGAAAASSQAGQQATNFKVTITLDGQIPEVRPGFTCSAEITTATRAKVLSVPIQAMAVRDLTFDEKGSIIRPLNEEKRRRGTSIGTASAEELPPGQTKKETEGVFVIRDNHAVFLPVKTGIAGDKYFEVLSGLQPGDEVITGPFNSVRDLQDGDQVKREQLQPRGPNAPRT